MRWRWLDPWERALAFAMATDARAKEAAVAVAGEVGREGKKGAKMYKQKSPIPSVSGISSENVVQ